MPPIDVDELWHRVCRSWVGAHEVHIAVSPEESCTEAPLKTSVAET